MGSLKRSLLAVLVALYGIYAALMIVACVLLGGTLAIVAPSVPLRRAITRITLRVAFFVAVMPYRFENIENLPDRPCVVIANHRSYLDGLLLLAALPPHFSAVIKHEMADVPLIGWFLRHVGERFVRRSPAMSAARDTLHLLHALKRGESLAIFPEGTFSTDTGLLPFREGAFFMAAKAGVPVVPVAMRGTRLILPEGRFLPLPGRLAVHAFEPKRADGRDRAAADRLRDRVEHILSRGLKMKTAPREGNRPGYAYYRDLLANRPLPLAYIDLDLLEANIRDVLHATKGKPLRLDTSVLPCKGVIERILRSDMRLGAIQCDSVADALLLADNKHVKDILVAYPTVQAAPLQQACQAIVNGMPLTLMVDATAHLAPLSQAAVAASVEVPVCVEFDMSPAPAELKGTGRRSSVCSVDELLALVDAIHACAGVSFRGVVSFGARRNRFAEWVEGGSHADDVELTRGDIDDLEKNEEAMLHALQHRGYNNMLVSATGSSSLASRERRHAVNEIGIGAELFEPSCKGDGDSPLPVAAFASEIIRRPSHDLYLCLAHSHVALDHLREEFRPRPFLPPGACLDDLHGTGAGVLPVRYNGQLEIGEMVLVCPPAAAHLAMRYRRVLLLQDGVVVDEVDTYRI